MVKANLLFGIRLVESYCRRLGLCEYLKCERLSFFRSPGKPFEVDK